MRPPKIRRLRARDVVSDDEAGDAGEPGDAAVAPRGLFFSEEEAAEGAASAATLDVAGDEADDAAPSAVGDEGLPPPTTAINDRT